MRYLSLYSLASQSTERSLSSRGASLASYKVTVAQLTRPFRVFRSSARPVRASAVPACSTALSDQWQAARSKTAAGAPDKPLDPGLYLVATPIGNLEDISLRALRTLQHADLVLAEDTRHSRKLLDYFGIGAAMQSLHEHNERSQQAKVFALHLT